LELFLDLGFGAFSASFTCIIGAHPCSRAEKTSLLGAAPQLVQSAGFITNVDLQKEEHRREPLISPCWRRLYSARRRTSIHPEFDQGATWYQMQSIALSFASLLSVQFKGFCAAQNQIFSFEIFEISDLRFLP